MKLFEKSEGFPKLSTMDMPGKNVEPKVLMVESAGDAPVSPSTKVANCCGRKRLLNRAVDLFPNETEDLGDAEIRRQRLGVRDRSHLTAGVQVLGETRSAGVGIGSDARVVLVVSTSAPECPLS